MQLPMRVPVISMLTDVTSVEETVAQVQSWSAEPRGRYICVSNVHMCMEVFDHMSYALAVNRADLTVPDGKPIALAQRILGHEDAKQVRGEDLTLALCRAAEEHGFSIGFYGATESLLVQLQAVLKARYPRLNIVYAHAPPFRPMTSAEDAADVEAIDRSGVDVLFVGLGCPKQEVWMAEHRDRLSCVMLGVGAAFDFISGNKKNAPRWMQAMGLEWLFRLISEPNRLWKRYLRHNPRFLWYFTQQCLGRDFSRHD